MIPSKEDILNKHIYDNEEVSIPPYYVFPDEQIQKAMDEHAKNIAIGFHNWREERFIDITYNIDYGGDDNYIPKITFKTPPPRYTIEQLYQSYLQTLQP